LVRSSGELYVVSPYYYSVIIIDFFFDMFAQERGGGFELVTSASLGVLQLIEPPFRDYNYLMSRDFRLLKGEGAYQI
jgi:hypothetical protein